MGKALFNFDLLKNPISRKRFNIKAKAVGLPPGTLIHVGQKIAERPRIEVIDYSPQHFTTLRDISVEEASAFKDTDSVSWINLSGIHDIQMIDQVGQSFGIHPLALEDILNTLHRPKVEVTEEYTFIIVKMLAFDEASLAIDTEQFSLILGSHFVLSFQEREGDVFDGVRDRLQRSNGRIRQRGPDYLAYALIDSIVDSYFQILEKVGDHLVQLEEELIDNPDQSALSKIHHFKREVLALRKSVWPLREVISELYKDGSSLITEGTQVFLRDLYDHTIQVLDTVEIFRDTVSGLQDLYMSAVGNRMNEIMKVLTIMASIFIPLTFVAGIYGMNFEYIPELKWRWGYFGVLGFMIGCVIGMIFFFRRKRWF
ncbi:MAG: magnesium/cobalt transporter CorA [Deltaproteobacteria bacterium]|jgi:magnesium transporter|nr:magnesium/cobalt transporter CorA [Deltaproteobacteria bacterium]MBW2519872.1 magnesium/cobalt transporter CorA [Deltaproteobacteria bacterium]